MLQAESRHRTRPRQPSVGEPPGSLIVDPEAARPTIRILAYDKERYERLRKLAFEMISRLSDATPEQVATFFVPDKGAATPKVDVRAAIIRDDTILLVKETADGRWSLPGGWADVNEPPRAGVERETFEESGYTVSATRLFAIKDQHLNAYQPKYPVDIYKLFFLCEITGGAPRTNLEVSEIAFFKRGELPELSTGKTLAEDIELAFAHHHDDALPVYLD